MTRAPIGEFTNELRTLKQRSSHTYQALADALDRPVSTIHGWITGRHLPYARDNADFERLLGLLGVADSEPWMTRLSRLRTDGSSAAIDNPYRGLESFTEDDARIFHGRGSLTDQLEARVDAAIADGTAHPLMVIGASGSGKTSLLRAGLIAKLRARGTTRVAYTTPGNDPIGAVSGAIPTGSAPTGCSSAVLIVDQFEEAFSPDNSGSLDPLIDLMAKFHDEPGATLVIGMRADFFHRAADIPFLLAGLQRGQTLVGPMGMDEVTDCIVQPARSVGIEIDADLLAELLSAFSLHTDLAGSTSALPLLSHVLYLLAEKPTGNKLTLDCYRAIGGLESALRQTADAVLARFGELDVAACRFLFTRMVELGHDALPTRRTATLESVRSTAGELDVDAVIGAFAQQRLLTTDVDTVTISHEALLTAWPRLAGWIDDERDALIEYRRITDAARAWDDSGRNPDLLGRGATLTNAVKLLDDPSVAIRFGQLETDFVTAGVRASEARRADRRRAMSRHLAIQATTMRDTDASLSSQLAVVANITSSTVESRSVLMASTSPLPGARFLGGPGQTALGVSGSGQRIAYSNATDNSITILDKISGTYQRVRELQLPRPGPHTLSLSLSPHGRWMAAGDADGGVAVTDLLTTRTRMFRRGDDTPLPGPTNAVAFNADGSQLFVACEGASTPDAGRIGGLWWWDVAADGHREPVGSIELDGGAMAFSMAVDRRLLVASTRAGHVHLWDTDDTRSPLWSDTSASGDPASAVCLSPDGHLMAAGHHSGRVRVWRIGRDHEPIEAKVDAATFASWINWVEFSPDGTMLTAASSDGNVRFWRTSDLKDLRIDLHHPTVVICARFTDERKVITSAEDGTVRVWQIPVSTLVSKNTAIWSVTTNSDGDLVATASRNRAVIWRTDSDGQPQAELTIAPRSGTLFSGASCISPSGELFAVATRTGPVMVHNLADPSAEPKVLQGLSGLVENLAMSRNGRRICGVDAGGHVRVWSLVGPHPTTPTGEYDCGSHAMTPAFNTSGDHLAVALESGEVALFAVDETGGINLTERWKVGTSFSLSVSFHPTLPILAAANADRTVSIWRLDDDRMPELTTRLTGPGGKIMSVAFSPDGDRLAAGVTDGRAWIWGTVDPTDPSLVAAIQSPEQGIYALTFSPDGSRLHAAGPHQRLFSWLIDDDAAADAVRNAVGDEITPEEWAHLIPSMPYSGIGLALPIERPGS